MGGVIGMGMIIVVVQGQGHDKMIDTHDSDQVLVQEKTIYTYLADPNLEIDHLDTRIDIHLDMTTDIAQDQDQDPEKEDLPHPEMGVLTANHHRIYLPSHLNGIKTSHHQ